MKDDIGHQLMFWICENEKNELDRKIWHKFDQESFLVFYVVPLEKRLTIDGFKVSQNKRRRGIGTGIFEALLEILNCINEKFEQTDIPRISEIYGELSTVDFEFGDYDSSIPFYKTQADKHGLSFRLYQLSDMRQRIGDGCIDIQKFISDGRDGEFTMTL